MHAQTGGKCRSGKQATRVLFASTLALAIPQRPSTLSQPSASSSPSRLRCVCGMLLASIVTRSLTLPSMPFIHPVCSVCISATMVSTEQCGDDSSSGRRFPSMYHQGHECFSPAVQLPTVTDACLFLSDRRSLDQCCVRPNPGRRRPLFQARVEKGSIVCWFYRAQAGYPCVKVSRSETKSAHALWRPWLQQSDRIRRSHCPSRRPS